GAVPLHVGDPPAVGGKRDHPRRLAWSAWRRRGGLGRDRDDRVDAHTCSPKQTPCRPSGAAGAAGILAGCPLRRTRSPDRVHPWSGRFPTAGRSGPGPALAWLLEHEAALASALESREEQRRQKADEVRATAPDAGTPDANVA